MDLSKLSTADKVISGSAIGLFIFMFFDWFEVSFGGSSDVFSASAGGNGFDVGFIWGVFPMLLGFLMLAIVALRAFSPDTDLPDLPFSYGRLLLGLGGLAGFLVTLKLIIGEDDEGIPGIEISRQFGLFAATLFAIGLGVGGFLKMQEDDGASSTDGGTAGGTAGF